MQAILEQIEQYKQDIQQCNITDATQLETYRIKYLGTKGIVKSLMAEMKNIPNDQKKDFGQLLNNFKLLAEQHQPAMILPRKQLLR
jgi:phenylalanyl-tRNA synthetase alpha chain